MDRRDFLKKTALGVAAVAATSLLEHPAVAKANELINPKTNNNMKKILILNGSPRKNGKTASLVRAFVAGAEDAGNPEGEPNTAENKNNAVRNEIREDYIHDMEIKTCLGCDTCMKTHAGCVQKDAGMAKIYEDLSWCDVVVFASPVYFAYFTAQLKTVVDRMWAWFNLQGNTGAKKSSVLIMTSRGEDYTLALEQYGIYQMIGWKDLGHVLGAGKEEEARALGASIK